MTCYSTCLKQLILQNFVWQGKNDGVQKALLKIVGAVLSSVAEVNNSTNIPFEYVSKVTNGDEQIHMGSVCKQF